VLRTGQPLISSHCPAVVSLVERHFPKLIPNLAAVVSPMIAMGRFIKGILARKPKSFISAPVLPANSRYSRRIVQRHRRGSHLREIDKFFKSRGINPASLTEAPFDGLDPATRAYSP